MVPFVTMVVPPNFPSAAGSHSWVLQSHLVLMSYGRKADVFDCQQGLHSITSSWRQILHRR